jgi:hypothetical protein
MGPSCPHCEKSDFSYRALLSIHPRVGEFSPFSITCPSCGTALRVTAKSRLIGAAAVVGALIGSMLLLARSPIPLRDWQVILVAFGVIAAYYFAIWPVAVRLKPWAPFQYWLPKNRFSGYFAYLLLPVALMALLFYLAVKFKVGM